MWATSCPVGCGSDLLLAIFDDPCNRGRETATVSLRDQETEQQSEFKIIHRTHTMGADVSRTVDENRCRRTTHAIRLHRRGYRCSRYRNINTDWMGHLVLVQEGFKRDWPHRLVVLENRVQADDGKIIRCKSAMQLFSLWNRVADTTRTQHLEGMQQDDVPAQTFKSRWFCCVEPLADMPRSCYNRGLCGHVCQLPARALMSTCPVVMAAVNPPSTSRLTPLT